MVPGCLTDAVGAAACVALSLPLRPVAAAGPPVDLVVACDCVYPDPDGPSPDAGHFVAALAALCTPQGPATAASTQHGDAQSEYSASECGCNRQGQCSVSGAGAVEGALPPIASAAAGDSRTGDASIASNSSRDACEESASARALVTFEARSDEMRAAFLKAAEVWFRQVRRVPVQGIPPAYRVEHIELYELRLC